MADIIDPRLRDLLNTANNQQAEVSVILRLRGACNERRRHQMEALGLGIDVVSGDLVTGHIALAALEALSRLPYIAAIQAPTRYQFMRHRLA